MNSSSNFLHCATVLPTANYNSNKCWVGAGNVLISLRSDGLTGVWSLLYLDSLDRCWIILSLASIRSDYQSDRHVILQCTCSNTGSSSALATTWICITVAWVQIIGHTFKQPTGFPLASQHILSNVMFNLKYFFTSLFAEDNAFNYFFVNQMTRANPVAT